MVSFSAEGERKKEMKFFYRIGMPPTLSRHFGHLFVRDPLIILEEHLDCDDDLSSYHFEVSLFICLFKENHLLKFRI